MTASIVPQTLQASIPLAELTTADGHLVLVPRATAEAWAAAGHRSLTLTVLLPEALARPWPTLTEAARLHVQDVDGLDEEAARGRLRRAIAAGRIRTRGRGRAVLLDPDQLDAWRLACRERDLERDDERDA